MSNGMNALWLMSDEHNAKVASYAGNLLAHTPAIDAIANLGTVFEASYTPNPICVPARRAFHSGRMGSNIQAGNYIAMGAHFKSQGFKTAWFGKRHWDLLYNPFDDVGVDCGKLSKQKFKAAGIPWNEGTRRVEDAAVIDSPVEFHQDFLAADQAIAFLQASRNKPFFCGVSLAKPHFPFMIQQAYYEPYANELIDVPQVSQSQIDDLSMAMKIDRDRFGFANLTDDQIRFATKIYYGMVKFVDDQIARVMATLNARGLADNTIVVYMSDHGEMLGDHGIWYKNTFLDGGARVPTIVHMPGMTHGIVQCPTNTIDLYPTLCDLCEIPKPTHLEGHSLVPLMDGSDSGIHREAFSENKRHGIAARMIRTNDFKYCYYDDGQEQLYDMLLDPEESDNLASNPLYAATKDDLRTRALAGWNPDGLSDGGE